MQKRKEQESNQESPGSA
uniref:Uncharacterized protein n=1 Tax=Rhizophora mucronata TaxID=61149 RepID=A0A2P2R5D7_RHIMU